MRTIPNIKKLMKILMQKCTNKNMTNASADRTYFFLIESNKTWSVLFCQIEAIVEFLLSLLYIY